MPKLASMLGSKTPLCKSFKQNKEVKYIFSHNIEYINDYKVIKIDDGHWTEV